MRRSACVLSLLLGCRRPAPNAASAQELSAPQASSAACPSREGARGASVVRVRVGGSERSLRVYAGRSYDPRRAAALVLNFHGLTSSAEDQEAYAQMNDAADARGLVVAYPEGLDHSWNAGACCGSSLRADVDDVAFVRAAIDALQARWCLDPRRVFATGMSNGAFLSYRLACELSDRVAAIAPVAGVQGVARCSPPRAVPVLHFHGTRDTEVPYEGRGAEGFVSVADTVQHWVRHNGCAPDPAADLQRGDVRCQRWSRCRDHADVRLCTVDGGGHTWPGAFPLPFLGSTTHAVSATALMLDFFDQHPMPARE